MSYQATPYQLDALREYLSIGVGKAAATLNTMLGKHIDLKLPEISIFKSSDFLKTLAEDKSLYSSVTLGFKGSLTGNASVVFDTKSAAGLVSMLVPNADENPSELDEISESTLTEVGNIIINSVMGTLSNCFSFELDYLVPQYRETLLDKFFANNIDHETEEVILFGETFLIVEKKQVQGKVVIFLLLDDLKNLLETWKESDKDRR